MRKHCTNITQPPLTGEDKFPNWILLFWQKKQWGLTIFLPEKAGIQHNIFRVCLLRFYKSKCYKACTDMQILEEHSAARSGIKELNKAIFLAVKTHWEEQVLRMLLSFSFRIKRRRIWRKAVTNPTALTATRRRRWGTGKVLPLPIDAGCQPHRRLSCKHQLP